MTGKTIFTFISILQITTISVACINKNFLLLVFIIFLSFPTIMFLLVFSLISIDSSVPLFYHGTRQCLSFFRFILICAMWQHCMTLISFFYQIHNSSNRDSQPWTCASLYVTPDFGKLLMLLLIYMLS